MDIYEFNDYRLLIRARIKMMPRNGYGQLNRMANELGILASLLSHVLRGNKNLTEDQGYGVCKFFGFNEKETSFFLLLLQHERVAGHELKKFIEKKIAKARLKSKKLKNRVHIERELTFENQAVFYSDWVYMAVYVLTSIDRYQTIEAIADHLRLARPKVSDVVNWLVEHGLCKEKDGRIAVGPSSVYVDKESPLVNRHHGNWRQKALETMSHRTDKDFFMTVPFSSSESDVQALRAKLITFIGEVSKNIVDSAPEVSATLNIDLFRF